MPSPLGHALAGMAIAGIGAASKEDRVPVLATAVAFALIPDLDLVPGIVIGTPNLFHHGFTHSLFFVIVLPFLFFTPLAIQKKRNFTCLSLVAVMAGISHIVLDFFGMDHSPPYGVPLFWPVVPDYFIASRPFFLDIQRSANGLAFFASLFSAHNFLAAARELLILGPLVSAVWFLKLNRWSKACD